MYMQNVDLHYRTLWSFKTAFHLALKKASKRANSFSDVTGSKKAISWYEKIRCPLEVLHSSILTSVPLLRKVPMEKWDNVRNAGCK